MTRFDVAVIGGGIHGVGVAQAAAAAGHSVIVIEKDRLAAGTSSKSSKLIHGGLRYLESYEFRLVAECLRERALLLRLAPELVKLQPFHIPVYDTTRRSPLLIRAGLSLYALLAGFSRGTTFGSLPRSRWDQLDGLRTEGLRAVFRYHDAQTDDRLLTRAVMRSAQTLGARLLTEARVEAIELHAEGAELEIRHRGESTTCSARFVVNAAGPWVHEVLERITPVQQALPLTLVQGSHLEFEPFCHQGMYYVESPRDGRAVFVMPRKGHTLVGTTEVRYRGHPDDVHILPAERNYLVSVVEHYFPQLGGTARDRVRSGWAGLRVLPAGEGHAFHRSRETILELDDPKAAKLLTIYGGKLTAYRATAERVVRSMRPFLPRRRQRGDTTRLPLAPA
ncbi:MAG: FAD-dependent oxidoreductase [Gammaproteobacteria bacterium]|nr:FAD-dependent oxidoreductase [Gammaproteobacteria bacterium]